jgi:hypothetical protein
MSDIQLFLLVSSTTWLALVPFSLAFPTGVFAAAAVHTIEPPCILVSIIYRRNISPKLAVRTLNHVLKARNIPRATDEMQSIEPPQSGWVDESLNLRSWEDGLAAGGVHAPKIPFRLSNEGVYLRFGAAEAEPVRAFG